MENSRIYVGQRYVPLIMGEWTKSETYEGLSIVTYEGNSYTSKKSVPIGIDISNEDYWVITGNYDVQIENYRNEVQQNSLALTEYKEETSKKINGLVNINEFDVLTGESDDTKRIQRALDFAFDKGLLLTGDGEFNTSDTLYIYGNCDLTNVNLVFNATPLIKKSAVVIVGGDEGKLNISLPVIKNNGEKYDNKIGVTVHNLASSMVVFNTVENFSIGYHILGEDKGNVYNTYTLKETKTCKTGILLECLGDGWVNQNTFIGGRIWIDSTSLALLSESDIIQLHLKGSALHPINNNTFIGTSLEINKGYNIQGNYSTQNMFLNCRYEGSANKVNFVESSNDNMVIGGFSSRTLVVDHDSTSTRNTLWKSTGEMELMTSGTSLKLTRTSSGNDPVIEVFNPDGVTKRLEVSAGKGVAVYDGTKAFPLYRLSSGGLAYGDGSVEPDNVIRSYNGTFRAEKGNLGTATGGWNTSHFQLGMYHLWVDTTGKLRIKNAAPTNDLDGNLVGV